MFFSPFNSVFVGFLNGLSNDSIFSRSSEKNVKFFISIFGEGLTLNGSESVNKSPTEAKW